MEEIDIKIYRKNHMNHIFNVIAVAISEDIEE